MTSTAPQPARLSDSVTGSYTAVAREARRLGLHRRGHTFYAYLFFGLVSALGAAVAGLLLLGDSWLQLIVAGILGVVLTQLAFLAHEASHRQVLTSGPANDRAGWTLSVVLVGISYSWWMNKHTRHHAHPNQVDRDPDVAAGILCFVPADAASRRGAWSWLTARQGLWFFPLLLLEGLNLHVKSVQHLWVNRRTPGQRLELIALMTRLLGYLAGVFWLLPPSLGLAFIGIQLGVFGVYLGASFAPNHIAMPIIARNEKLDFFTRQVRTSRNVAGGWWATALMGGLNYQIEHHLFPSMPRPHLAAARRLVRQHCQTLNVTYTETSLIAAWAIVTQHLNRVGLTAVDPFRCPTADQLR